MALPPTLHEPAWVREFKAFILRGNVLDLAVGIIIGAAFTAIVASVVDDLINPVIGLLVGGIDFSNVFIVLSGERRPTLEATRQGGAAVLAIGSFVNAVIKFLIVGFAIFWLVKGLTRFRQREAEKPVEAVPPAPTPTEALLREIRDELRARNAAAPSPGPAGS